MSDRRLELNGLANIDILLQMADSNSNDENFTKISKKTYETIKLQLKLLERYMLAYNDAVSKNQQTPYWHEILANPTFYPTNRDRLNKL